MLLASTGKQAGTGSMVGMIIFYVALILFMLYFMVLRPSKNQQKSMDQIASSLEVGDSVLTASGFYGVIVTVEDEIVVVEFGSNKNCRIPMKKAAITAVEKPDGTTISMDR
ncbi:MAG: preprotein translocase subunit YajC [Lachnospiraceae bacterium]|nr:preprotein translocase subunit YajC [Lachnospiraceae bacterium]